jgi:plasmid stabilization system protein ParE
VARKGNYALSPTARNQLREARRWSLERWGPELRRAYFADLDAAAQKLALIHNSLPSRTYLTGDAELHAYPVREHFLIYMPIDAFRIAIVAVIRQGRNLPEIVARYRYTVAKELPKLDTKPR